jgi:hypothetical protein
MIRHLVLVLWLTSSTVLCTGCHHIKSDYPAFLAQHPPKPALPHVPINAQYTIAEETMRHSITYRSVAAGYGNKWILEVGNMLDQTMQSAEVRGAFGSLTMLGGAAPARSYHVEMELQDYYVADFAAHMTLRVKLVRDGDVLLDKVYKGDGGSNEYSLAWGNARKALQAATKRATENILREFLGDMQPKVAPSAPTVAAAS